MSLIRWQPLKELETLCHQMNQVFDAWMHPTLDADLRGSSIDWTPAIELHSSTANRSSSSRRRFRDGTGNGFGSSSTRSRDARAAASRTTARKSSHESYELTDPTQGETMTTRTRSMWQNIKTTANNVREFMAGAMRRIFGVNDDDYPATGIQPFEGEPAEEKHF